MNKSMKFWCAGILGPVSCVIAAWFSWDGIDVPIYLLGVIAGLCLPIVWRGRD